MNTKIMLRFHKTRLITTLGWTVLLILGLLSRGLVTDVAFWLVMSSISVLLIIDIIYFIARVSEGHYLLISDRKVFLKQFFQPVETITIAELTSVIIKTMKTGNKHIILSDGNTTMEIKRDYMFTKENIVVIIQESNFYPKELKVTHR